MLQFSPLLQRHVGKKLALVTNYKLERLAHEFPGLWIATALGNAGTLCGGSEFIPKLSAGQSFEPTHALNAAVAEFLERHGATCEPVGNLVSAPYLNLPSPGCRIALEDMALFAPFQLAKEFKNIDAQAQFQWLLCDLFDQSGIRKTYFPLPRLTFNKKVAYPYDNPTTSGLAIGSCPDEVFDKALAEIIERDAFLNHWWKRIPPVAIVESELSRVDLGKTNRLVDWLGERLLILDLYDAWNVPVYFALVWGRNGEMPIALGGSCHADPKKALIKAIQEATRIFVQLNEDLKLYGKNPGILRADDIHGFPQTAEFYSRPENREHYAFLRSGPRISLAESLGRDRPTSVLDQVIRTGARVVRANLTPIDSWLSGLTIVRAFVPEAIPFNCWHSLRPWGCPALKKISVSQLNSFPPPFL